MELQATSNQQSFGMNFSNKTKESINIVRSQLDQKTINAFKKLENKKDGFEMERIFFNRFFCKDAVNIWIKDTKKNISHCVDVHKMEDLPKVLKSFLRKPVLKRMIREQQAAAAKNLPIQNYVFKTKVQ